MAGPVYGSGFVELKPQLASGFGAQMSSKLGPAMKAAGVAALSGVAAAVTAGIKGVVDFAGFEQGINEVLTLIPNAGQDAFGQLSGQVQDFSKEFGVLPNDVIPALYDSLSAGVPRSNVFGFLETAQKAAKGGVTDLSTAVDGISSVVNAYGEDVISGAEASDQMFTAVRLGKTTFDELSSSLFNVTPTASALGVNFGDVTASLAALTAQGVPTSVATTQMRQLFVELSKEGGKAATMFEDAAGTSFKEFIAGGGNVQEALQIMQEASSDAGLELSDAFGSVEAGSAAAALTSQSGAEALSTALGEMNSSAGATQAAYEQMDQGLAAAWDRIKSQGAVAFLQIGEAIAPFIHQALDLAQRVAPQVREKISQIAAAVQPVVVAFRDRVVPAIRNAVEFVGPIISRVVGFIRSLGSESSGTATWLTDTWAMIRGIFSSAFDAIRAIVSTGVSILTEFWTRFGTHILAYIRRTWANIRQIFSGALNIIQGIFEFFAGLFTGDWSRLWGGVQQIVSGAWNVIQGIVRQAVNVVRTVIAGVMAAISQIWSEIWERISRLAVAVWQAIVRTVRSALTSVQSKISAGMNAVRSVFSNVMSAVRSAVSSAMSTVRSLFSSAMSTVRSVVSSAGSAIRSAFESVRSSLSSAATGAKDAVVDAFRSMRDSVSSTISSMMSFVSGIPGRIVGALGSIGSLLYSSGQRVINGLIDGIRSRISAIGSVVSDAVSQITDRLPFSPAKMGPLSGSGSPDRAGAKIVSMIADGMQSKTRRVAAAADQAARAAAVGLRTTPTRLQTFDGPGRGALAAAQQQPSAARLRQALHGINWAVEMDPSGLVQLTTDGYAQAGAV